MRRASSIGKALVRDQLAGRWRFERTSSSLAGAPRSAVIAQWSSRPRMTRSTSTLVHELQRYGYQVVVVSACESTGALNWGPNVDVDQLTIIRKPNVGYDFGSWSIALAAVPEIASAERVLLANDSMAGPFIALKPLLDEFDSTRSDVWGLTDTYQFGHHLQSYFLGFAGGILKDRPLQEFWAGIRHETDKTQIILRNEVGLSRLLGDEGYVRLPAFPHESLVLAGQNPVIIAWRKLLQRGFPFLKREILRDPSVAPGGRSAPSVLRAILGVDVHDWVEDRGA